MSLGHPVLFCYKKIVTHKKREYLVSYSLLCDPHGARTHDPNINSVVLYQLS